LDLFVQQLLNGLVIGSTYAVVAIGFSLVFTVLRIVNFAHPEIFMVGMFGGLFAGTYISDNFFVMLGAGAITAMIVGGIVERLVLRPLRHHDMIMGLIATLGVAFVLSNGMAALVSSDPIKYPQSIPHKFVVQGFVLLSMKQVVNLIISALLLAAVSFYVHGTRYGRATRAIAERPDIAAAFGVNVDRVSQVTVMLASAMAGIAAVSIGTLYSSAYTFIGLFYGVKSFICMLVAGNRYFEGVIIIALVLGILEAMVVGYVSSAYRDMVAFSLLIVVLFFRPEGIFGSYSLTGDRP
jgi:branched-chain amino acid transport system permease protein